jgi:anti-sigma B factor antagonist
MTTDVYFEATESRESGVPVLNVRGEIDVSTAPELHGLLADVVSHGPQLVIVNLTDVSFIDSTGLGVLVEAVRDVRGGGGDLRLVVTQPQIIKVLELTGLDKVFDVLPDTAGAVIA